MVTFTWVGVLSKRSPQMSPYWAFRVAGKKLIRDGSGGVRKKPVVTTCPSNSVFRLPSQFLQTLCYLLHPHGLLPGGGPVGLYLFWGKVRSWVVSPKCQQTFAWVRLLGWKQDHRDGNHIVTVFRGLRV